MNKFYVIADLHYCHFNIIKYCGRPFDSAEQMDEKQIANWNNVVSDDDRILVLGDFGLTGRDRMVEIISRLNGHKEIILGNHDRGKRFYLEAGFEYVYSRKHRLIFTPSMSKENGLADTISQYPDLHIVFTHVPLDVNTIDEMREEIGDNGVWPMMLNVHGHTHEKIMGGPRACVSVEQTEYAPVTLRSVVENWLGIKE